MVEDSCEDGSLDLSSLRQLARQYVDNHMYTTAIFWADKIYTLSGQSTEDCLWLAHVYYLDKQYSRATHLLRNTSNLVTKNSQACYLVARCLFEEKEYKEALDMLETTVAQDDEQCKDMFTNNGSSSRKSSDDFVLCGRNSKLDSAMSLLKGRIHDMFENKVLAIQCYKDALQHDVFCFEAFQCLVLNHMMDSQSEVQLLKSLPFAEQCSTAEDEALLKAVYGCHIGKYLKTSEKLPIYLNSLCENTDFVVAAGERCFSNFCYKEAFRLAKSVYWVDPLHSTCLSLYISCLVHFEMKNELYYTAHKLVNAYPQNAVSWYAVGNYYLLLRKNEMARKYFSKATTLNQNYGPAWLGFAQSYASDGERDQAISAYYSVSKVMPGSHLPYLYLGLEYSLSHNTKLASKFYKEALTIGPDDFHVQMELGVLAYQNGEFTQAEVQFIESLRKVEALVENADVTESPQILEPLYANLGHVSRKLHKYDEAIVYHQKSMTFNPRNQKNLSALALCYFLKRDFELAVQYCHKALALKRHDTLTIQLLEQSIDCHSHVPFDNEEINDGEPDTKISVSTSIDLSCRSNNITSEIVESIENNTNSGMSSDEDVSAISMDMSMTTP